MHKSLLMVLGAVFLTAAIDGAQADWVSDTRGCRVWSSTPQPNESVIWSGPCTDGFAHGRGLLVWLLGGIPDETYTGELQNGHYTGRGVQVWKSGAYYDGDYENDQAHGRGTYRAETGEIYSGTWVNGCFRDGSRRMAVGVALASCP